MNIELSNTVNEVVKFTNQHQINAVFQINTVDDLTAGHPYQDSLWAKFEGKAGVYILMRAEGQGVHYIGMSEKGIGGRLYGWLFKPNKVNDAVKSSDIVLTITLEEQSYMAPALESYLISKLETNLNVMKIA